jgi:hypothetical protein
MPEKKLCAIARKLRLRHHKTSFEALQIMRRLLKNYEKPTFFPMAKNVGEESAGKLNYYYNSK